jgi:hypothetical protein
MSFLGHIKLEPDAVTLNHLDGVRERGKPKRSPVLASDPAIFLVRMDYQLACRFDVSSREILLNGNVQTFLLPFQSFVAEHVHLGFD